MKSDLASLFRFLAGILLAGLLGQAGSSAQEPPADEPSLQRQRAFQLFEQHKLLDALPHLETLALTNPDDMAVLERLGFCLLAKAVTLEDPEERRLTRVRAREVLLRSKELGNNSNLVNTLLNGFPEDGNFQDFSERPDVNAALQAGEAAFAVGDFKTAIENYELAFALDPANYLAPLFIGDVHYKRQEWDSAGKYFALAILNDPNRETAYRYWGDALMHSGRMKEAREKFIDSVVAEPYNRTPWMGLGQWAQRAQVQLSHPRIESPNRLERKDDNTVNITIDFESLKKKDGSSNWMMYEISRAAWKERFAEEFPDEPAYRHSLREEAGALRVVVTGVKGDLEKKKIKKDKLDPGLAKLLELEEKGLLEAYVLFARADEGIARDYVAYRETNRAALRRYLDEYVVPRVH
jgi:tetratricopeptide (TPR) repeat protein